MAYAVALLAPVVPVLVGFFVVISAIMPWEWVSGRSWRDRLEGDHPAPPSKDPQSGP